MSCAGIVKLKGLTGVTEVKGLGFELSIPQAYPATSPAS